MAVSNFAEMKHAATRRQKFVDIPCDALGGDVRLKPLGMSTGLALGKQHGSMKKDAAGVPTDEHEMAKFYVTLLKNSICDEDLNLMMLNDEGEEFLKDQPFSVVNDLGLAALKLNGFVKDDEPRPTKGAKANETSPLPSA